MKQGIQYIKFLVQQKQSLRYLQEWLYHPGHFIFEPIDPEKFSGRYAEVRSLLSESPNLSAMLDLHILTEWLIYPEQIPAGSEAWIREQSELTAWLDGVSRQDALDGTWQAVPVPLIQDGICHVRYFVIGRLRSDVIGIRLPEWALHIMDESCKDAIHQAVAAITSLFPSYSYPGFYCYPLICPGKSIQFEGNSLGLPISLGLLSLTTAEPLPCEMIATGALSSDGSIHRVGNADLKTACANKGFTAFMYPAGSSIPSPHQGMKLLPVSNLSQAWMFSRLYSPENAARLPLFDDMLRYPDQFVRNICSVPSSWITWAFENGYTEKIIPSIMARGELFHALVKTHERTVYCSEMDTARAISKLIAPNVLERSAAVSPLSAFIWCTSHLSMCNHTGKVLEAEDWIQQAARFMEPARKSDIQVVADYFNNYLVSRHKRYIFNPELPAELKSILNLLEMQYAPQCEYGCPTQMVLGRLYGTIAQHFAFCGPDFLDQTLTYASKAKIALGEHAVPEFKQEWMRQYNYLVYAFLDAGDRYANDTEMYMYSYLEIETWDDLWRRLDQLTEWQHAAFARFLADTKHPKKDIYFRKMRSEIHRPAENPWHLWCFNMGRLAHELGEMDDAVQWFRKSIELCLSEKFGTTIKLMALLPLSGLHQLNKLSKSEMETICPVLVEAVKTLNANHFEILLEAPAPDMPRILENVWNQPQRWFPFSYR